MTTSNQIEANQDNSLKSTGPKSVEGKNTVSQNAIKHGIFCKDLVVSSGEGKENKEEYDELYQNLIKDLIPTNKLQYLLVEKIAIDFWRLRRVIRFETGSIRKYLDMAVTDYYNQKSFDGTPKIKDNLTLDQEIESLDECIKINDSLIKSLKKREVDFKSEIFVCNNYEFDIVEELYDLCDEYKYIFFKDEETLEQYQRDQFNFDELNQALEKSGITKEILSDTFIDVFLERNNKLKKQIHELESQKRKNTLTEQVLTQIHNLPNTNDQNKILRYESSIQRSILQNLMLLKKLQNELL